MLVRNRLLVSGRWRDDRLHGIVEQMGDAYGKSIEKAVLPESVVAVMVTCSSSKGYMVNGVMFREGAAGVSPQGRLHNQ